MRKTPKKHIQTHRTHVLEVDTGSYNFCHISALYCPPCVAQPCVVDTCTTTAVAPEDTHSATDAPTCGHTMGVLYAEHEQLYVMEYVIDHVCN